MIQDQYSAFWIVFGHQKLITKSFCKLPYRPSLAFGYPWRLIDRLGISICILFSFHFQTFGVQWLHSKPLPLPFQTLPAASFWSPSHWTNCHQQLKFLAHNHISYYPSLSKSFDWKEFATVWWHYYDYDCWRPFHSPLIYCLSGATLCYWNTWSSF